MRKSGGKCYDLLLIGWLGEFFKQRLCRMRPCVGVGWEVLSIRCQPEQGGPGPANLQLLCHAPKGEPRVGVFPVPADYPGWCHARLVLLTHGPIRLQASTLLLSSSVFHCLCHRW